MQPSANITYSLIDKQEVLSKSSTCFCKSLFLSSNIYNLIENGEILVLISIELGKTLGVVFFLVCLHFSLVVAEDTNSLNRKRNSLEEDNTI